MTPDPHENDACPVDGWRRAHILIDGITWAICPYCHGDEVVP